MQETSTVETLIIKGNIQEKQLIQLVFTLEQFHYVEESLVQAYHKRIYHRDYSKKYRGDVKNISVKPAILLYLHQPLDPSPSIYYENVQAILDEDQIRVILNATQFLYIKSVLQRRYQARLRLKLKRQTKNESQTPIRNVKRPPAVLVEL